jgi:predicted metal-binding membrane protein
LERSRRRVSGYAWIAFLAIALLAWIFTVQQAAMMPMMGAPPLPAFLFAWLVMMVAMMFPSVAPTAILWMNAIGSSASGTRRTARVTAFIAGYLAAWTLYGIVAFALIVTMQRVTTHWIAGALFAFAGVYQLTPLKRACLRHCRSPFAALMMYAGYSPRFRDFRVGLHHGAYCVGCCWGLMAVLVAVGVMNVPAMIALSALIFLEKIWRGGEMVARVLGLAFIVLALGLFAGVI